MNAFAGHLMIPFAGSDCLYSLALHVPNRLSLHAVMCG